MGVDVSRCCDRPSVFPVGRSIIIYTYSDGSASSLQDKVADRATGGEVYDVVPPLTDQDQAVLSRPRDRRARFYANRIHLVASATLSRAPRPRRWRAWTELFARMDFPSATMHSSYPRRIGICAIVTTDCVGSAGVRRVISDLVINRVATSCAPINNSSVCWSRCAGNTRSATPSRFM